MSLSQSLSDRPARNESLHPSVRNVRVEAPDFRSSAWCAAVPTAAEDLDPIHPTLLHAMAMAARHSAGAGVTLLPDDAKGKEEQRSYARIHHDSKVIAASLVEHGVKRGDRVLMVMPTSFEFIATLFAVQRVGALPVPSYPPAALDRVETAVDRLKHIGNHCAASFLVTSSTLLPLLGDLARSVPTLRGIVPAELLLLGNAKRSPTPRAAPGDGAFIQYTSGSTGNPKGVVLTHRNVTSNIHAIGQALQVNRKDVGVSWLPLYHDMGLIGGLLTAIYWRMPLALMSPIAFLMRPARWLRAIHDHKGTISPAPNFAYALCTKRVREREREGLDLSSWRVALNGAEPISHKALLEFEQAFGPHGFRSETMYPVYGLAESSLAVTFPRPGDPPRTAVVDRESLSLESIVQPGDGAGATTLVCVGRPVPGHEVRVVNDRGRSLGDGRVGHVIVRGPSVMAGYFRDEETTARTIKDGWLWTGDLGYLDGGELYVTGRAKDIIIARGKNYYAEDIERVAEAVPGIRGGGAVAFSVFDDSEGREKALLVCESPLDEEDDSASVVSSVMEAVSEQCGLRLDDVVLVPVGTLPKTSSGKRQRSLTKDLYTKRDLTRRRTGRIALALVVARSGVGMLTLLKRRFQRVGA